MSTELNIVTEHALNKFFENAGRSFRDTEKFKSLNEIFSKIAEKYKSAISDDNKELFENYLTALGELHAAEIDFLYKQGYIDCVHILKKLTVI